MSVPNAFSGSYDYFIIQISTLQYASQEVDW